MPILSRFFVKPFRTVVVLEQDFARWSCLPTMPPVPATPTQEHGRHTEGHDIVDESESHRMPLRVWADVECIEVSASIDKISRALEVAVAAYAGTVSLDWPSAVDWQVGEGGKRYRGAAATGEGKGLSGTWAQIVGQYVLPLLAQSVRSTPPGARLQGGQGKASAEVAGASSPVLTVGGCLKRLSIYMGGGVGGESYVGALEVLGVSTRLSLAPTSAVVGTWCRRLLLVDPARCKRSSTHTHSNLDGDLVRLHCHLLPNKTGNKTGKDLQASRPLILPLLDFGGPPPAGETVGDDGGGEHQVGFLHADVRVLHEDDAAWRGKHVQVSLGMSSAVVNISLEGLANLQSFTTRAVSGALPASKQVMTQRLKSSSERRSAGVLYASKRPALPCMRAPAATRLSWSASMTIESVDLSFLLAEPPLLLAGAEHASDGLESVNATGHPGTPSGQTSGAGGGRDRAGGNGDVEEVEEVVTVHMGKFTLEEEMSLKQEWRQSSVIASLSIIGSRHLCGSSFAHVFTMPSGPPPTATESSEAAPSAQPEGAAVGAGAEAFAGDECNRAFSLTYTCSRGGTDAALRVRVAAWSGTALLALVTSVSVAVKRSRLYMDNMHKMLVVLNDVATRASLHMSQALMNRQRLSLHVLLGGACLRYFASTPTDRYCAIHSLTACMRMICRLPEAASDHRQ